jgi:uncharacterized phage-associated protein
MPHSSLATANEFLRRARASDKKLTQMHLQKLVYLSHGWTLALIGQPLIEDDIEAWAYGPVIRRLYDATRQYGSNTVTRLIRWGDDTPFRLDDDGEAIEVFPGEEETLVSSVWDAYKNLHAFQMSALTHADDSPWSAVFKEGKNRVIPNHLIRDYFLKLARRDQPSAAP